MEVMRVTVVGLDLCKIVTRIFQEVGLNTANQVNSGMLGNLKTLTYTFEISEDEIIGKRKAMMNEMAKNYLELMPMYVHGDWMRIFVMKPLRD